MFSKFVCMSIMYEVHVRCIQYTNYLTSEFVHSYLMPFRSYIHCSAQDNECWSQKLFCQARAILPRMSIQNEKSVNTH